MVRSVPAIRADPLAFLARMCERHGDVVAFPMPRTPVLLVNTPAAAREVLVTRATVWSKDTPQYGALGAVTGSGLLTADGEQWRTRRRMAQPAFSHGALAPVVDQSVAAAGRFVTLVPSQGRVLDVEGALLQATLEIVGRTLFGADVATDGERLVRAVLEALEVVVARVRMPLPVPGWAPTPGNRRMNRAVAELDRACAQLVARRRAAGSAAGEDLLGLLLQAVDAGVLDPRGLRDELVTMVIAGHETVASSLAWTLGLLAQHPQQQGRLHDELDEVLGRGSNGRDPTWDDLPALVWTRAVVDEALRLYPPAWVLSRRARVADVVAGVAVPAGTLVILSPWLLHRRADNFPSPTTFDPVRFTSGARPQGYLPFGAGARQCIGRDFALVESVLVLARILRDVRVDPDPAAAGLPTTEALVTLRPRGGMPLQVTRRD